jgi:hypothetical protein
LACLDPDFSSGSGSETVVFITLLCFAEPALESPSPEPHKSITRSRSRVGGGSCADCGRVFRSQAMLTKHRKQDHQVPETGPPGTGQPVLRIRDVYPGSRIQLFSIPDPKCLHPGSQIPVSDPGSSSKNLSILTPKKPKKLFLSSKKYDRVVHPGSRIRMLTFYHPGSRIPGSNRHPIPDPGSGSATLPATAALY